MKTLTRHTSLIFIIGIPSTILLIWLMLAQPAALMNSLTYSHWLLLTLLLVMAVSPWGRIRLAPNHYHTPTLDINPVSDWRYVGTVITLQLALQLLFVECTRFMTHIYPIAMQPVPTILAWHNLFYFGFWQGLFPWAWIAWHTIHLGLIAYRKHTDAYFHSLLHPLYSGTANTALGASCNFIARNSTLLVLSTTLLMLSLWLVTLVTPMTWPLSSGFNLATLSTIVMLFIILMPKKHRRWIKQKQSRQIPLTASLLLIALSFAGLIFVFNALTHSWHAIPLKSPTMVIDLQARGWKLFWQFFATLWWLCWLPMMGILLAHAARGYSVRRVIVSVGLWPVLSTLIWWSAHTSLDELFNALPNGIHFSIALIATGLLIYAISRHERLSLLIQCYLPAPHHYKMRPAWPFLNRVILWMLLLSYFYLLTGLFGLTLYFLVFGFLLALPAYVAALNCLYYLLTTTRQS